MPEMVTVTHLEMASPELLNPGRLPPYELLLKPSAPKRDGDLLRSIYARIGQPHGWGNSSWSESEWQEWLAKRDRQRWLFYRDDAPIGLLDLQQHTSRDIEIVVFGLVPEAVGRGYGGHALTLAVRQAWSLTQPPGQGRVWLHTSSRDHASALTNYRRRGFEVFKVEHEQRAPRVSS